MSGPPRRPGHRPPPPIGLRARLLEELRAAGEAQRAGRLSLPMLQAMQRAVAHGLTQDSRARAAAVAHAKCWLAAQRAANP